MYERLSQLTTVNLKLHHCTYLRHGDQRQKWKSGCDPRRIITTPPFLLPSRVSRYLTVLQRVKIRDGRSELFVWVWTRFWCVIFHFPWSSSGPTLLRLLYRRWRFAIIVFACKCGPVPFHQSPSIVMPHLMAVSSLPASLSTAGTWLVPRYAAYFHFLTDGNEQYAILNILLAKVISNIKNGTKKGKESCEERIQNPRQSLNQGTVSCDK